MSLVFKVVELTRIPTNHKVNVFLVKIGMICINKGMTQTITIQQLVQEFVQHCNKTTSAQET